MGLMEIGRNLYKNIIPNQLRDRIADTPFVNGLRYREETDIPYVLLTEDHIQNLKIVLNRNAFLGQLPKDATAAEIGVNRGDFSERILRFAQPAQLHLIDIWDSQRYHDGLRAVVENRFADQIKDEKIHIHLGLSLDMLATFDDHTFDWVYIDTDHTYATTAQELRLAARKVKKGGLICGHDYITGDWKLRVRYGVVEAVNEFCVHNNWEMVMLTNETHRHLSYALREIGT